MNNEIKEILEDNGELIVMYKDNSFECFDTLPKNVLDYITNLQTKNEYLETWNSEIKLQLDNLQQENETRQQDINNLTYQLAKEKEENERLKFQLENQQIISSKYRMRRNIYKSRCEKAIEYINSTTFFGLRSGKTFMSKYLNDLLNILQNGGDSQ